MSRYHSHINTAIRLIETYKGEIPFNSFMKQFFSKEKKFGSKDRKQIGALCYSYLRTALAFDKKLNEENMLSALFLCTNEESDIIKALKPEWADKMEEQLDKKFALLENNFNHANIFPFQNELNERIDFEAFTKSLLIQPDLFIRIRPAHKTSVIKKIKSSGIPHSFINDDACAELPAATKIDEMLDTDKEIVIQDRNSQMVLNFLKQQDPQDKKKNRSQISVWDCCAASGGKSILAVDLLQQKIDLTVSDIRPATILNLHQRFKRAGINRYEYFITDISIPNNELLTHDYDIIICDAPCSGSGTWSRTPEQLYLFDPSIIGIFKEKQKKIVSNVLTCLKDNGLFFYITCSVFKKENEEIAAYIQEQNMQLLEMKYWFGYDQKADSMFVAVFKKAK
jgi:16S rRNA (cytosine967-C5)-methyltransferase